MHCRLGHTDMVCELETGELCAPLCPYSPSQEPSFSPYPPLPCLEDLREPPPPCSESLSPPQLFPSTYSPPTSPFTCPSTCHSPPPHPSDPGLSDPSFYHLQLGSYLMDDFPSVSGCGHGSVTTTPSEVDMELDFSMPPVLQLMPPSLGPPSPSVIDYGSLGGFPFPPPLCPAPVQPPHPLTQ